MTRWRKCEHKNDKVCILDGCRVTKSDCLECPRYKPVEEPTMTRLDSLPSMGAKKVAELLSEIADWPKDKIEAFLREEMK